MGDKCFLSGIYYRWTDGSWPSVEVTLMYPGFRVKGKPHKWELEDLDGDPCSMVTGAKVSSASRNVVRLRPSERTWTK